MKISVKNFQSLKESEVEIKPLTLLTGPSNCGKSALIRAVDAALFNAPGNDFITTGKDSTTVVVDNYHKIEYKKGKSTTYAVDGIPYSAVGRGQLDKIAALGYRELVDGSLGVKPQFSLQHDPPFLVSNYYPNSLVSGIFANLGDVVYIVKAKYINEKTIKRLTSEFNVYEQELNKALKQKECFSNWSMVSALRQQIQEKSEKYKTITNLTVQYNKHLAEKTFYENLTISCRKNLNSLNIDSVREQYNLYTRAQEKITLAKALKKLIASLKEILEALVLSLKEISGKKEDIDKKKDLLTKIKEYQMTAGEIIDYEAKVYLGLKQDLDKIKSKMAEFDTCPVCGGELKCGT